MSKIWGTTLFLGETKLDTIYGEYIVKVYQNIITKRYILTLIYHETDMSSEKITLYTRIHSSCVTSEMLNSQDCDCVEQLNGALKIISEKKQGILFYLIQEGRGCGYIGKARACQMVQHSEYHHTHCHPDESHNEPITTFDAYHSLGMKPDYRRYGNIKEILQMLNIYDKASFILLSNNPDKISAFKKHNIKLLRTENIEFIPNSYNKSYLVSKNKYGHILKKTNSITPEYSLPVKPIEPFEPYHLENLKRFIYCASYYIPIKIFDNHVLLNDLEAKKVNIEILNKNNLYCLPNKIINNINIKPSYWFRVNLFYEISTNLDYIVLEYKNPYNDCSNDPIIRFHSESLFDRFPLKETLYQDRYKRSILEIVKNGFGYLILFYRDGRGSGLGYYLLNLEKLNSKKIGITKDMRDYDAAIMLMKHFTNNKPVKILYSSYSVNSLKSKLNYNNVLVSNYINIDNKDIEGKKSIISRIINLENNIIKNNITDHIELDKTKKYIITGIGTSKSHCMYLIYLLKKHYSIDIIFQPIIYFSSEKKGNEVLIVISQGLSHNSHIAIKKWNYSNILLITGLKIKDSIDQKKQYILTKLKSNNSKILYFQDDMIDNTLVRITGPVCAYKFIYDSFIPIDKLRKYEINHTNAPLNNHILNLLINKSSELNIYILSDYPFNNFIENLGNRLMETIFCNKPTIIDYYEFVHGTYQASLLNNNNIFICLESILFEKFTGLFQSNVQNIICLKSLNCLDLKIIDYEMTINKWIYQIAKLSDLDFINWKGKDLQNQIYHLN